jgi:hypothetical protein
MMPSGATWMMHGAELFMAKQSKLITRFYFILFFMMSFLHATGAGRSMEWRRPQLVSLCGP